ncbi:MAG: Trp family transcriptional regulator [Candidatus Curtissbacteria bacterium]|nr:Trp family transcriptional regulator [Candidatus Curtissbacteria bacterium]
MPRASKYKLTTTKLTELESHFSYLISSLNKPGDIKLFFDEFLTSEEKLMLTKRLVLIMMLKRDYPDYVCQGALHISYETVRNYKIYLNHKSQAFDKTIDRLISRQKTRELFEKIDKVLKPLELALKSGTNMKARAKFASGDWT